ncbi:unnamed protein product, partial [Nesidiocoris tenuis]
IPLSKRGTKMSRPVMQVRRPPERKATIGGSTSVFRCSEKIWTTSSNRSGEKM